MFENSFNYYMPKSTVDHLEKWGETTRLFHEEDEYLAQGTGSKTFRLHVKETLMKTGEFVERWGKEYPIFKFTRVVWHNGYGRYGYYERDEYCTINIDREDYSLDILEYAELKKLKNKSNGTKETG